MDDRSSAVSLPEVPLLGVLPGTGGLTRLTDKRKVRRDLADIFCTTTEGVRGQRAKDWRLVDEVVKPQQFAARVTERALELAAQSDRPAEARGVALTPLARQDDSNGYRYRHVEVRLDARARQATLTVRAPEQAEPEDLDGIVARGADWWPLAMARELDDAILMLRTNHLELGTWLLKTEGAAESRAGRRTRRSRGTANHWFVRETIGMLRRTLARLETSSRTLFALVEPGSCFAGTLFELALAADRTYMLDGADDAAAAPAITLSALNFGTYPAHRRTVAHRRPVLRRERSPSMRRAPPSAVHSMPRRRWRSDWSPRRRTISTGPTNCASRSKSARACRPMRSPAWKRICASAPARPWPPASSGGSPPGRTGSSTDPMRSANSAR